MGREVDAGQPFFENGITTLQEKCPRYLKGEGEMPEVVTAPLVQETPSLLERLNNTVKRPRHRCPLRSPLPLAKASQRLTQKLALV